MLEAKKLTIGYKGKEIAQGINLVASAGQFISLLGQNGVGKSTLIRTLANMQPPLSGVVQLDGISLAELPKSQLATKVGIVTTKKVGTSNMTVYEMVSLGRYPYTNWFGKESQEDIEKVDAAISVCEIDYLKGSKLGEISDGQYQKTMIARAIAQDTDFIILDEPTAHLDIVNRKSVFKLLKKIITERNKGIIVSTHELDLAKEFSDELWLMDFNSPVMVGTPGRLQDEGAIDQIFHLD